MASIEPAGSRDARRARMRALFARLRITRRLAARLTALGRRRVVLLGIALVVAALLLFPPAWLAYDVYFDRSGMPDLEAFIRFEPPTTGVVRDVQGKVLIELACEYRRVVTHDEVAAILRLEQDVDVCVPITRVKRLGGRGRAHGPGRRDVCMGGFSWRSGSASSSA